MTYHNVYKDRLSGKQRFRARKQINGASIDTWCGSEREAALQIDYFLIRNGQPPVNILKKQ